MRRISCFFVCCSLVSFVVAPPPPTEQPVAQAAAPNVDSPVNENRAQQQEAVPVAPHQMQDENEQINRNFAQQPPPPPPQNIPNNNIPRFQPKNPRRPDGVAADTAPRVPKVQVDATEGTFSLAQNPACVKSIRDHCGPTDANMNNLNVLECFHNLQDNVNDVIDGQCLHEAWKVKLNFTQSDTFLKAADSLCAEEFQKLPCETVRSGRKGEFLACVIEHHEAIEKFPCKQFLVKLETIVFSDFHLISGFTDACGGSIERFQCGRITTKPEFSSQTHTIQCLTQSFDKLDDKCQHALLRVGELQGEDFHLDRGLFFACRDDRELLCHDVLSGEGRVYSCLMRFKNDPRMSEQCQKQIYRREQLVQRDYRVSKGLVKSCREDIKRYQCRKNTSDLKEVRLAQILLCLEAAMSDGNTVSGQCQAEILEHRRALLEPLGLSPELVVACDTEIRGTCAMDKQYKNKAPLECLMDLAAPSKHGFQRGAISDKCLREVETLLKEANAGEDWRVDPFVRKTCQPVVSEVCRDVQAGEGRVLQCLMQHLGSPAMTADCEESLLRLMYFVSRDFELDPKLYRNCRDDARLHCSARTRWGGETGTYDPEPGLVVLSCLYHIAVHPEDGVTLQHRCEEEVRRVMRTRGEKVDLHPEIEDYCMSDLAAYCSANVQRGQEIICLQDNMNKLSKDCREKIAELTIDEDRHAEDSPYMMKYCGAVAKEFCSEYMSEGAEEEDLMDCLIGHKSKMSEDHPKCYAAITHFQLITLEDVKFSRKFEVACAEDVAKFCYDGDAATDRAKTTEDIIECLSEVALEEALGENELEKTEKLHPKCKKQLMKQLRHEEENVDLNPRVKKICSADINKFCSGINKGSGRVVECLKEHFPDLEKPCKEVLFRTDTLGAREDRVDFSLTEHCHGMIERYKCDHRPLECLKKFKDEPDFDKKCHVVILRRMIEQSYDFRMNPELQEACKLDIGKFCARHLIGHTGKAPKILEGEVLSCLRDTLATKPQKLTETCKLQVQGVVENAAKDVRLNPHLMKVCKQTIGELCRGKSGAEVEECLKSALLSGDSNHHGIKDEKCKLEVVKIIAAEETDIHLDPILFGSCVAHIPVACPGVPRGEGRQLKCLLGVLDTNPNALSIECREKLKSRKAMFAYADSHVKSPESLIELRDIVFHSPASNFFILFIVGFALFVFFGGLAFGRVTKQLRQELKNK